MRWKWCTTAEVRALADPQRLPGYLAVLEEFEQTPIGPPEGA